METANSEICKRYWRQFGDLLQIAERSEELLMIFHVIEMDEFAALLKDGFLCVSHWGY